MKRNFKRSGDEAGLAPTNEESAKSPRSSRLDSMPVIPSQFAEALTGILQEKDVASRIFTITKSSGDQCKLKVKGAVLNMACRSQPAGLKPTRCHGSWATPSWNSSFGFNQVKGKHFGTIIAEAMK